MCKFVETEVSRILVTRWGGTTELLETPYATGALAFGRLTRSPTQSSHSSPLLPSLRLSFRLALGYRSFTLPYHTNPITPSLPHHPCPPSTPWSHYLHITTLPHLSLSSIHGDSQQPPPTASTVIHITAQLLYYLFHHHQHHKYHHQSIFTIHLYISQSASYFLGK